MVSIRLVMNGGIIDRAEKGTKAYSEAEIGEQLKLVYAEYQMGQYQTPVDIEARLKEIFGQDTTAALENGKLKATINGKVYQYDANSGKSGEYQAINYGSKTKETVQPGDDITIETEKFKVFSVSNGEIKAMPYYNLKLDSNPIKQVTEETVDTAGTDQFSSEAYWSEQGKDDIDMSDSKNNIQKYITAYKTTLEGLGAEGIQVRIAKKSELNDLSAEMKNPGQKGSFWLGSSGYGQLLTVWTVGDDGSIYGTGANTSTMHGVRPIIIIQK